MPYSLLCSIPLRTYVRTYVRTYYVLAASRETAGFDPVPSGPIAGSAAVSPTVGDVQLVPGFQRRGGKHLFFVF